MQRLHLYCEQLDRVNQFLIEKYSVIIRLEGDYVIDKK